MTTEHLIKLLESTGHLCADARRDIIRDLKRWRYVRDKARSSDWAARWYFECDKTSFTASLADDVDAAISAQNSCEPADLAQNSSG